MEIEIGIWRDIWRDKKIHKGVEAVCMRCY